MNYVDFDNLVERETKRMKDVMCGKSADYAAGGDKLFNFKLAAEVDGVTPIEALRGMWLKHRTSLRQGLDELMEGKPCRSEDWWIEKLTDDRNYSILLQALLIEKYFVGNTKPMEEWVIKFDEAGRIFSAGGWSVYHNGENLFLQKDGQLHKQTGWKRHHKTGEAPGFWLVKEAAEKALTAYLGKEKS